MIACTNTNGLFIVLLGFGSFCSIVGYVFGLTDRPKNKEERALTKAQKKAIRTTKKWVKQ